MTAAKPRSAEAPLPLGEVEQAYAERALTACLLADPPSAMQAIKESKLCREDVSATLGAVIAAARDLLRANEPVTVATLSATLQVRKVEHPNDFEGWYSYLTAGGLSDRDPLRWCKLLRARALRQRLVPAAMAASERRVGALERLAETVNELMRLHGGGND